MVMMDNERIRKGFNEARAACLLRDRSSVSSSSNKCRIKLIGFHVHEQCKEDEPYDCPLFVFIRKVSELDRHGR